MDLCDHQSVVNIARFSPCGRLLASASEKQVLIYTRKPPLTRPPRALARRPGRCLSSVSVSVLARR